MAPSPTQPWLKGKKNTLICTPISNIQHSAALSTGLFQQPSNMVGFCHQKTELERSHNSGQMRRAWRGRRSWETLHSVIVKWELSFWISYIKNQRKIMWIIYPENCLCFLPCTTRSRLSLALRSLFSKTENPALILTDRSCIQNSAWVNICTSLFFGQTCWAVKGGGGGEASGGRTGRETVSARSGPSSPFCLYNRRRGEGFDAAGLSPSISVYIQIQRPGEEIHFNPLYWVNTEHDGKVIGLLW